MSEFARPGQARPGQASPEWVRLACGPFSSTMQSFLCIYTFHFILLHSISFYSPMCPPINSIPGKKKIITERKQKEKMIPPLLPREDSPRLGFQTEPRVEILRVPGRRKCSGYVLSVLCEAPPPKKSFPVPLPLPGRARAGAFQGKPQAAPPPATGPGRHGLTGEVGAGRRSATLAPCHPPPPKHTHTAGGGAPAQAGPTAPEPPH